MSAPYGSSDGPKRRSPSWPPKTVLGMLSEASRDGLLSLGVFREYSTGSTILMEGDDSRHVIALHGGWVKVVTRTEQGGQALLALRSRGELIGEQSALDNEPRSASVISASPVTAYVIQRDDFMRYLDSHSDAQSAVAHALSGKLRWATRRRTDFSGLATDVRVARVVSELARMNSRPTSAGIELGYGLTQPELAAMVGVSEPSVQRALRKLRESGVLGTSYRKIVILDMARLDMIAGPEWNGEPEAIK